MSSETAEPTLIDQIRRGDTRTWHDFIAAYEGRLAAFVRARLGDPATVDDVVQETFVGFLLSLPNYDSSRGVETYLFAIASHKLTDHLRRQGRRPTMPLAMGPESSDGEFDPADLARSVGSVARSGERKGLEAAALAEVLRETLARWREKGEDVRVACLELLFVRGKSNKETAALLEITEQNVANYKFDFLTRLRDGLRGRNLSTDVFPELTGNDAS
ncbi:MAG: RNA polymerase sigma factor [Planctomycetia bacterium]|nr:RNA polymerase sigma factor [Planctomycetia bacterium]